MRDRLCPKIGEAEAVDQTIRLFDKIRAAINNRPRPWHKKRGFFAEILTLLVLTCALPELQRASHGAVGVQDLLLCAIPAPVSARLTSLTKK